MIFRAHHIVYLYNLKYNVCKEDKWKTITEISKQQKTNSYSILGSLKKNYFWQMWVVGDVDD